MENTVLKRFINSHDKLIVQLRSQIDKIGPIAEHRDQLNSYKIKLIDQMESILNYSKQLIFQKEYQLKMMSQQISENKIEKKVLENKYIEIKQKAQKYELQCNNINICAQKISQQWEVYADIIDKKKNDINNVKSIIKEMQNQQKNLQLEIKQNKFEIRVAQNEALQTKQIMVKIQGQKQEFTKKIQNLCERLQHLYQCKEHLQNHLKLITDKIQSMNSDISQKLITLQNQKVKNKQIIQYITVFQEKLRHYFKLLKSEASVIANLSDTQKKAKSLLQIKLKQNTYLKTQIEKYNRKVQKKKQKIINKTQLKNKLEAHIKNLQSANDILLGQIKNTCQTDAHISYMLQSKNYQTPLQYRNHTSKMRQTNLREITNQLREDFKIKSDTFDSSQFSSAPNINDF